MTSIFTSSSLGEFRGLERIIVISTGLESAVIVRTASKTCPLSYLSLHFCQLHIMITIQSTQSVKCQYNKSLLTHANYIIALI